MKLIRDYVLHGEPIPLSPNTRWRPFYGITAASEPAFSPRFLLKKIERASFLFGNWARMLFKRGEFLSRASVASSS
jgi:hypothetical protein